MTPLEIRDIILRAVAEEDKDDRSESIKETNTSPVRELLDFFAKQRAKRIAEREARA